MKFGPFQNFKDKFLSRGKGRIEAYTLCAYGKLPIYKDYILWECNAGGSAEFKRWLDDAFGMSWEEFEGKGVTLRGPARAMLLLPGGKHAAAMSIWPSTDEGGLRKFPFCVFSIFSRGDIVGRGVRGAIESLQPVWRSLECQYKAMKECRSIDELYSYLQRATPLLDDEVAPSDSELDLATWFADLDATHGNGCRAAAERTARSTISAYRSFPEQGESLAVRVPLATGQDVAAQAELWAEVFQSNIKKMAAFPSLIIEMEDGGGQPKALGLVWRELKKEDARLFGEQIESYEFIENLVESGVPRTVDGAAADPVPADGAAWVAGLGQG